MTPCEESTRTPSQRYPLISVAGRQRRESRHVWEQANGPIPDGMFVCHSCDNTRCIRLEHLFLGTPQQNMDDKIQKGRLRCPSGAEHYNSQKTECVHGHALDEDNTYVDIKTGKRSCRACRRERAKMEIVKQR